MSQPNPETVKAFRKAIFRRYDGLQKKFAREISEPIFEQLPQGQIAVARDTFLSVIDRLLEEPSYREKAELLAKYRRVGLALENAEAAEQFSEALANYEEALVPERQLFDFVGNYAERIDAACVPMSARCRQCQPAENAAGDFVGLVNEIESYLAFSGTAPLPEAIRRSYVGGVDGVLRTLRERQDSLGIGHERDCLVTGEQYVSSQEAQHEIIHDLLERGGPPTREEIIPAIYGAVAFYQQMSALGALAQASPPLFIPGDKSGYIQ